MITEREKTLQDVGTILILTYVSLAGAVQDNANATEEQRQEIVKRQASLFLGLLDGFGYTLTKRNES